MWWIAEEVKIALAKVPESKPVENLKIELPGDYLELAAKVGYKPKALRPRKTLEVLAELGLSVFDKGKVSLYLDKQFGRDRGTATWGWRELTATGGYFPSSLSRSNGDGLQGPYTKPIPYPVLQTMAQIKDRIPDAQFFISDETTESEKLKDPFLMVRVEGEGSYIIERWDEPSFRG